MSNLRFIDISTRDTGEGEDNIHVGHFVFPALTGYAKSAYCIRQGCIHTCSIEQIRHCSVLGTMQRGRILTSLTSLDSNIDAGVNYSISEENERSVGKSSRHTTVKRTE